MNSPSFEVLILQRICPPYRVPFFQALSKSPSLNLTLSRGNAYPGTALESISPPDIRTKVVKNLYLRGEQLVWQRSVLRQIWKGGRRQTVIAEFNPRILSMVGAFFLARCLGQRWIWWGHGFRPNSGRLDKKAYIWLSKMASAMIFYSESGLEGMVAAGLPTRKGFVAWNSIETSVIDSLAEDLPFEKRNRILYIGRLIAEKKIDLLIQGFAKALPQLRDDTVLTILGDGLEKEKLSDLTRELGVEDRVEFVAGIYDQEPLSAYFNSSWVSVSSGYIGLSAIHSLAYGVPMIVADKEPHSPEIAAIEDNVNAYFFEANSPASLAECLIRMNNDRPQSAAMGAAGRKTVQERFSVEAMVKAFESAMFAVNKK